MVEKISVITVSFNSAKTIRNTIESVLSQDYQHIEYIVIDGGSTDGAVDIVQEYGNRITKVISESDNGIYDAMNKGIRAATGDVIGFINSDDYYPVSDVLTNVMQVFTEESYDICYGDLCYVDQNKTNEIVRYWKSSKYIAGSFRNGWCPPHPTFFVRRNIYEHYGMFDLDYKIAADFELMMRLLEVSKLNAK